MYWSAHPTLSTPYTSDLLMDSGISSSEPHSEDERTKTTVWVIEDDLACQRLFVHMLDSIPEINCSFVSSQCKPALDRLRNGEKPDVVLMDISLKGEMDGIEGTWELKELDANLHILALTNNDAENTISSMIMAGVSGYLLKSSSKDEIINSIRQVQQGESPLTPSVASIVMRLYRTNSRHTPLFIRNYNLSKRELEVLQHLSEGKTKKGVAAISNISEHTVDTHIRSIYRKLDVRNRSAAIIKAVREGLVTVK